MAGSQFFEAYAIEVMVKDKNLKAALTGARTLCPTWAATATFCGP